jgi:hypothetical protein
MRRRGAPWVCLPAIPDPAAAIVTTATSNVELSRSLPLRIPSLPLT